MTKKIFLLRKRFWLTALKILALVFVGSMIVIQIPEIRYDFGSNEPVEIANPQELTRDRISQTTFVSISGRADFDKAFIYRRYGLDYTYFLIQPYGIRLVARTYEKVSDEWKTFSRFLGKLRPFDKQPFSCRIREIYRDRFEEDIPEDAFFLAVYDVPRPSGWQIGAMIFASLLWIVLFFLFFFFKLRRRPAQSPQENEEHPSGDTP